MPEKVPWCEPYRHEGLDLERSGTIVHHPRWACNGGIVRQGHCPFHNPSDHLMVDWDMLLRETGLIERVCPHGIGHPDPDSLAFIDETFMKQRGTKSGLGVHGCDGCCHDPLAILRQRIDRLVEIADS